MPTVKIIVQRLLGSSEISLSGMSTVDLLPDALSLLVADCRRDLAQRPQAVERIITQLQDLLLQAAPPPAANDPIAESKPDAAASEPAPAGETARRLVLP